MISLNSMVIHTKHAKDVETKRKNRMINVTIVVLTKITNTIVVYVNLIHFVYIIGLKQIVLCVKVPTYVYI
jgi:hypothetical protein